MFAESWLPQVLKWSPMSPFRKQPGRSFRRKRSTGDIHSTGSFGAYLNLSWGIASPFFKFLGNVSFCTPVRFALHFFFNEQRM